MDAVYAYRCPDQSSKKEALAFLNVWHAGRRSSNVISTLRLFSIHVHNFQISKQLYSNLTSKYVTWYWIQHYIFIVFLFNSYAEVLVGESWGKLYSKLLFLILKNHPGKSSWPQIYTYPAFIHFPSL
jgi:hypothetical protein